MNWIKIEVTTQQIAEGELQRLSKSFVHASNDIKFMIDDVVVFAGKSDGKTMLLYLSPKAANTFSDSISQYMLSSCETLVSSDVESLFFGNKDTAWACLS